MLNHSVSCHVVSCRDPLSPRYNSSCFAYGQTGSGKTYTMMGELALLPGGLDERGLAPRMIEHLFSKIAEAEDSGGGREILRYSCRASVLEIYNETITDLLNPSLTNLMIREDPTKGIYVDGLSEKEVLNVNDVMQLMQRGHNNRHVGETNMNARSSRSHSVFTFVVERTSKSRDRSEGGSSGVTGVVSSRLNLIDLAGSERVKGGALGGSQAQGDHFKEACHINQSLTTLGRVIMELVESQRVGGDKPHTTRHIPYRDSRLTFLLQDSLGGNAKSLIIANVSSSSLCAAETVSTLQFVSRAKCIRNKASINLLYRGDVALLQKEIIRLNTELDSLRRGPGSHDNALIAATAENKELRARLEKMERRIEEDDLRIGGLAADNARLKMDRRKIEARLEEVEEASSHARAVETERESQSVDLNAKLTSLEIRLAEEITRSAALKEEAVKMVADAVSKERERGEAILSTFKQEVDEQLLEMESLRNEEVSSLEDELAREKGAHAQERACLVHQKVEVEGSMRSEVEALRLKLEESEREREHVKEEAEANIRAAEEDVEAKIKAAETEAEAKIKAAEEGAEAKVKAAEIKTEAAETEAEAKIKAAEDGAKAKIKAAEEQARAAHDLMQKQIEALQEKIQVINRETSAATEAREALAKTVELKERAARADQDERHRSQVAADRLELDRLNQALVKAENAAKIAEEQARAAQDSNLSLSSQLSEAMAELSRRDGAIQSLNQERLSHRTTVSKQAKAFGEIMKLIEMATTPPGSSSGSPEPEAVAGAGTVSVSTVSGTKKLRESLVGLASFAAQMTPEHSGGQRDSSFSKSRISLLARGGDLTGDEDDVVASPMAVRRDQ